MEPEWLLWNTTLMKSSPGFPQSPSRTLKPSHPLTPFHTTPPHSHTQGKSKLNSKICKICVRVKQKCIYSSWKESILMSSSSPARVSTLCCAALWLFGQWNNLIHQCLYTRIPQMQFSKWPPAHIGTWVSSPTVILAPRQSLLCRLKI